MKQDIRTEYTMGLDLGDKKSRYAILDGTGTVVEEGDVATTREGLSQLLKNRDRMLVVMEAGTHSPWVSRQVRQVGHQDLVANPRKVALIYQNRRKRDRIDAITLARLGRSDRELLHPIEHRSEQAQQDLALLRSRDALIRARTRLVAHVRGVVKAVGERLEDCDADNFHQRAKDQLPAALRPILKPIVETIGRLTRQIGQLDRLAEQMVKRYSETARLQQVNRVGPLTSLAYVLTLEDPGRFASSRSVGAFVGLVPGLAESGTIRRELGITKHGDRFLRGLLVQCAQQILGPFGEDCDLKRFGQRLAAGGGRNAKKRATVAVARKLAVLLHHLWVSGDTYDPLYNAKKLEQKQNGVAKAQETVLV